jgi:hypothetical protein
MQTTAAECDGVVCMVVPSARSRRQDLTSGSVLIAGNLLAVT